MLTWLRKEHDNFVGVFAGAQDEEPALKQVCVCERLVRMRNHLSV